METVGRMSQRQHALLRAYQRYGLSLTDQEYEELSENLGKVLEQTQKTIMEGKRLDFTDMKLLHLTKRTSMWRIEFKNQKVLVIFCHSTKAISTFLPTDSKRSRLI
jgi:hypothetical protein